jgi:hypothetical protein
MNENNINLLNDKLRKTNLKKVLFLVRANLVVNPNNPEILAWLATLLLELEPDALGLRYLSQTRCLAARKREGIDFVSLVMLNMTHRRLGKEASTAMARNFLKHPSDRPSAELFLKQTRRLSTSKFPFTPPAGRKLFETPGRWSKVLGGGGFSIETREARTLRAMAVFRDELYCCFSDNISDRHSLGKWDGRRWKPVADHKTWAAIGLPQIDSIAALVAHENELYATVCHQGSEPFTGTVCKFDGETWRDMGSMPDGLKPERGRALNPLIMFDKKLYAGAHFSRNDTEKLAIFSHDGIKWDREILNPPESVSDFKGRDVYEFVEFRGKLYCGTAGYEAGSGTVWCREPSGWELVGGAGIRNSWESHTTEFIEALTVYQDRLVVASAPRGRQSHFTELLPSIWVFDGETWDPLVADDHSGTMAQSRNYNHLFVFNDHLLAATGMTPERGPCEVAIWELNVANREWQRVAGAGIRGSWNGQAISVANPKNRAWVYRMIEFKNDLYTAISYGNGGGAAELWRHQGFGHEPIKGDFQ